MSTTIPRGTHAILKMQKFKILIAEDESVSRHLMEASLTNWGHEAISTDNGEQAREILHAGGIHICILDWEMPGISGIELCRWIRTAHLFPEPHVILLTGRKEPEHIQEGYAAGANDYIVKPFNRNDLRARILAVTQK
ncbi:MAG TPA: response regulator [Candidatus Angelobacter sp.]|nr:response regulator [Candidatus Angelobacter sp.]